jgi:hypothetical protein
MGAVLVKVDSTVGKLSERSLLLELCTLSVSNLSLLVLDKRPVSDLRKQPIFAWSCPRRADEIDGTDSKEGWQWGICAYRQPPRRSVALSVKVRAPLLETIHT